MSGTMTRCLAALATACAATEETAGPAVATAYNELASLAPAPRKSYAQYVVDLRRHLQRKAAECTGDAPRVWGDYFMVTPDGYEAPNMGIIHGECIFNYEPGPTTEAEPAVGKFMLKIKNSCGAHMTTLDKQDPQYAVVFIENGDIIFSSYEYEAPNGLRWQGEDKIVTSLNRGYRLGALRRGPAPPLLNMAMASEWSNTRSEMEERDRPRREAAAAERRIRDHVAPGEYQFNVRFYAIDDDTFGDVTMGPLTAHSEDTYARVLQKLRERWADFPLSAVKYVNILGQQAEGAALRRETLGGKGKPFLPTTEYQHELQIGFNMDAPSYKAFVKSIAPPSRGSEDDKMHVAI